MVLTLQKIRDQKEVRRRELESELEKIKRQLINMGAVKIILFGSYAQGDIRIWSEVSSKGV